MNVARSALLSSICCLALAAPAAVMGQEPAATETTEDQSAAQSSDEGEAIVVTGSRLRANATAPQPIVGVTGEDLEQSGAVTVSDLLNELPQLGNSFGAFNQDISVANRGFNVGTELVNLRGLGSQRTLVLVNGRRHVSADPGTSAVDLNSIPAAMIEKVEIVTGANSAVYGADAVSGVVNVILKRRYEGTEVTVRTGISDEGDGAEYGASVLHGGTLGDRLTYVASAEYSKREGFLGRDRDWVVGDGSGSAYTMGAGSSAVEGGRYFTTGPAGVFTYPAPGASPVPFTAATPLYQRVLDRHLQVPIERGLASINLRYELAPAHEVFLEGTYGRSQARLQIEPGFMQLRTGALVSPFDVGPIPANAPGLAAFLAATGAASLNANQVHSRRLSEIGPRESIVDRDLYRVALGLAGQLGRFDYQVYYQYGKVSTAQEETGSIDRNKFYAGVNNCAGAFALSGCVPINIFGRDTINQAAIDWLLIPDVISRISSDQHVVSGYVAGDLFTMFGSPLSAVLGAEYRKEKTQALVHPSLQDGSNATRQISAASGGADVKEIFGELRMPLFSNLVELGGAARLSDYSTVGTEYTWNGYVRIRPTSFLLLRGSYGRATRAPDVRELFSPIGRSTSTLLDPCANDRAPQNGVVDPGFVPPAGCTAQLGSSYIISEPPNGTAFSNISGGNPDLNSETADTLSFGAVLTAPRLLNLVASIDYYDIRLDNVIGQLNPNEVVRQCYVNQTGLPETFCSLIDRLGTGNRSITTVRTQLFNIARERVRGLDVQASISRPVLSGTMSLTANYTHLLERSRQQFEGSPSEDYTGRFDANRHEGRLSANFVHEDFSIGYTARVLGAALKGTSAANRAAVDNPAIPGNNGNEIGAYVYHDLQASMRAAEALEFTIGVKNLTDKEPPLITSFSNSGLSGSASVTAGGIYDVRGRYFYSRISVSF